MLADAINKFLKTFLKSVKILELSKIVYQCDLKRK